MVRNLDLDSREIEDRINKKSTDIKNKVRIEGSVIVSGDFQLEKAKTVKGLIELSQGFEKDAITSRARLFRENNGAVRELITVNIDNILKYKRNNLW